MSRTPQDRRLEAMLIDVMPALLLYLQRRVGADDAPDLLGDTLVIAWRRIVDLPIDDERARMWLFGIARGTLQNHGRGERRRLALVNRLRAHVAPAAASADEGDEVRDAIGRLPPEQGELIRLVHWDGFTVAEAAEILGVPVTTARSRYRRAKTELRAALGLVAVPAPGILSK